MPGQRSGQPGTFEEAFGPSGGTSLGDVRSVSICQYPIAEEPTYFYPEARLFASAILTGAQAQDAINRIERAPVGSGPNYPQDCSEDYQYGSEVIVLRVQHVRGASEIYLRFDGCDHHGFEDGTTVHRLTRDAVSSFLLGGIVISSVTSDRADEYEVR